MRGPFVATIKKQYKPTQTITNKYRTFASLEEGRDWLFAGSIMVRDDSDYTLHKIEAETLLYESKTEKIAIFLSYDHALAARVDDDTGELLP